MASSSSKCKGRSRKQRPQPHELPDQQPQSRLELCICANRVGLYRQPPATIANDADAHLAMTTGAPILAPDSEFTYLLSGSLSDFLRYSNQENSQWVIDIAHDICDPALKRGLLVVLEADGETWRMVNANDPLTGSTYRYEVNTVISPTKISHRTGRSITTSTDNASTMADRVIVQRDNHQCWVSRFSNPLVNSHICPKRLGNHLLHTIYRNFVSAPSPDNLTIYDAICGITLLTNLDNFFDLYKFGLRFVAPPNEYICHYFLSPEEPADQRCTIFGVTSSDADSVVVSSIPDLHGLIIRPPRPQDARNPPPGLLRWHYLQCVIRKFAHPDYKGLQNIHYSELPIRMKGDSDDEGTDSECRWPSDILDRGRAMQEEIKQREEQQERISEWIASSNC